MYKLSLVVIVTMGLAHLVFVIGLRTNSFQFLL